LVLGGSWRFLEVLGGSWRFLEVLGGSWRFLGFFSREPPNKLKPRKSTISVLVVRPVRWTLDEP